MTVGLDCSFALLKLVEERGFFTKVKFLTRLIMLELISIDSISSSLRL